jgi:hypothetical protein
VFTNPGGVAVNAEGIKVESDMFCRRGFQAHGEVNLPGAHVGHLSCSGGTFSNPGGNAILADGLRVDRNMFCRGGFQAEGEVRLLGAHVGGELDFDTAGLVNPEGYALNAYGVTVAQSMSCGAGFHAQGEVTLVGAHIGGNLSFDKATILNPGQLAGLGFARDRSSQQRPDAADRPERGAESYAYSSRKVAGRCLHLA